MCARCIYTRNRARTCVRVKRHQVRCIKLLLLPHPLLLNPLTSRLCHLILHFAEAFIGRLCHQFELIHQRGNILVRVRSTIAVGIVLGYETRHAAERRGRCSIQPIVVSLHFVGESVTSRSTLQPLHAVQQPQRADERLQQNIRLRLRYYWRSTTPSFCFDLEVGIH